MFLYHCNLLSHMNHLSKMLLAVLMLSVLVFVAGYGLYPYVNAFLGAGILYVILKPFYKLLILKLKMPRSIAAFISIILSFLLILIPLYLLLSAVIVEIQTITPRIADIPKYTETFFSLLQSLPFQSLINEIDLKNKIIELASNATNYLSTMLLSTAQNVSQQTVSVTILIFVLYYLLTEDDSLFVKKLYSMLPFNEKNSHKIVEAFPIIVKMTAISSIIIAIIEGLIIYLVFYLLNINGALLWGIITAILTFVPVVGATLVWIPAALIQLLQQNYIGGIIIIIAGIIMSFVDNLVRPLVQKRIGSMHPLMSLIGIIIGINIFGLIGLVIGPLLLMYVILIAEMVNEEYFSNRRKIR